MKSYNFKILIYHVYPYDDYQIIQAIYVLILGLYEIVGVISLKTYWPEDPV
jgi:hypothetical protein